MLAGEGAKKHEVEPAVAKQYLADLSTWRQLLQHMVSTYMYWHMSNAACRDKEEGHRTLAKRPAVALARRLRESAHTVRMTEGRSICLECLGVSGKGQRAIRLFIASSCGGRDSACKFHPSHHVKWQPLKSKLACTRCLGTLSSKTLLERCKPARRRLIRHISEQPDLELVDEYDEADSFRPLMPDPSNPRDVGGAEPLQSQVASRVDDEGSGGGCGSVAPLRAQEVQANLDDPEGDLIEEDHQDDQSPDADWPPC